MIARLAGIANESVTDGPGLRLSVFFQGCPHACPGCHNPQTWKVDAGEAVDVADLAARLEMTPLLSGLTFSGGEPFLQAEAASSLASLLGAKLKSLWVYTGYRWEDLLEMLDRPGYRALLTQTGVLVDGPFRQAEKDLALPFRGSRNQRLILVPESLASGRVVTWEPDGV
jgi:anaerobic ribonucleoside-triphosphate reductase activating protein